MNRRQASKLLTSAFGASFLAPSAVSAMNAVSPPAQAKPVLFQKSTYDKTFQNGLSALWEIHMGGIGIPANRTSLGFPLSNLRDPMGLFNLPVNGVGMGGVTFEDLLISFKPEGFEDPINRMLTGLGDPQQDAEIVEQLMMLQEQWEGMTKSGFTGAEIIGLGLVGVGAAGVVVAAAGVGLLGALAYWGSQDDDGDGVKNYLDKFPYDSTNHVIDPATRYPDMFPTYPFLVESFNALKMGPSFTNALEVDVSLTATGDSLLIDYALSLKGDTSTYQLSLKA